MLPNISVIMMEWPQQETWPRLMLMLCLILSHHHIDNMLLNESMWLLNTTTLSVAQIAERLHFADSTTFARFFRRMKGVTPSDYRNRNLSHQSH